MHYYLSIISSILTLGFIINQQAPASEAITWVQTDQKLIGSISAAIRVGPKQVERYYIQRNGLGIKENLGFGWAYKKATVGGGYISIRGIFYYENDQLVSYTIYPDMPHKQNLTAQYRSWYAKAFPINSHQVEPFSFNAKALQEPLNTGKNVSPASIPTDILRYMSPASGTEYGYSGGFANTLLANRQNFLAIQSQLRPEHLLLIMRAINPASRLTAIEYYWKNRAMFNNQLATNRWVEQVFNELPQVDTMFGCTETKSNARALVHKYSQEK